MANNKRQVALQTVINAFDTAKPYRESSYDKKWNEYFRLSKSVPEKVKYKWMSNRFIPYTKAILSLILPRLVSKRPGATVVGLNEESEQKQTNFNELLTYEQDQMNIDLVFTDWMYDALRYGTGFIKMGWKKETAKNLPRTASFLEKIKAYFQKLGRVIKNDEFLYDGPCSENVDIFDLYIHPKATDRDNALYMIHRMELSKYQMKQNPNYSGFDSLSVSNAEVDETRKARMTTMGITNSQAQKIVDSMSDQYFEVLEYWGLFDIDGDGVDEECVIAVANRETVIRFEENPYYHGKKPFIVLKYNPEPHFFYGEGVIEIIRDSQLELNDIANQSSDMRKLTLLPFIKVKKNANMDVENLKIAPGMPFIVEDKDDITFDRPPDFTQQLEFMSKSVRQIMQVATGATDVSLGQEDVGIASDTATGAQIAQEQTSLRFRVPALMLDSAIEDFGNMLISLNQQFFDRSKSIKIFGENGPNYEEISPQDISGKFSYKVQTMSMAPQSKAVRRTELVNLRNLLSQRQDVDLDKLDRMITEQFDVDPDTIFKNADAMGGEGDFIEKFRMLPPEVQQQLLAKMPPEDQALLQRALGANEKTQPVPVGTGSPNDAAGGMGNPR